jgi:hypothetical protein
MFMPRERPISGAKYIPAPCGKQTLGKGLLRQAAVFSGPFASQSQLCTVAVQLLPPESS